MKETLSVQFKTVTPMFLSGADPMVAEVRVPSVKGALRFWYRAVDPHYRQNETALFGSGGEGAGQSRFLIRVKGSSQINTREWEIPQNREGLPGVSYLSFSLKGYPQYILPSNSFELSFYRRRSSDENSEQSDRDWIRLLAALWLLGHIGGLGSRARRGFGSLSMEVKGDSSLADVITRIPQAHGKKTPEAWREAFQAGIDQIRGLFEGNPVADHTVLDRESTFHLSSQGYTDWKKAMNKLGMDLKLFREGGVNKEKSGGRKWRDGAAIGLPIFIPQRKWTFAPKDGNRNASPVWMRVVKIGQFYHPFIAVLSTVPSLTAVCRGKKGDGRRYSIQVQETLNQFREHLHDKEYR